jgi:hypothetical protein
MFKSDRFPELLGAVAFFLLLLISASSTGDYQGGDTHLHYLIARYATIHHELLLNHWGKPFYTLIYCLPSSISYEFVRVFTSIIAGFTAYHLYRWGKELNLKFPAAAVIFLLFSPIYIWMATSAMTEVLFSFWLVVGLRLLHNERWFWGAVWLSFLPFIRTEGFVLLPFIGCWFIYKKRWLQLPLFALGTLVYTVVGGLYLNDFAWLITKNPYPTDVHFYGSGSWFHFIKTFKSTWGGVFFLGLMIGCVGLWFRKGDLLKKGWFLVLVPMTVYFVFHTIAWATGTMASLGEVRVLAAIMPLFALVAAVGVEELEKRINRPLNSIGWLVLFVLLGANAFVVVRPPIKSKGELVVMTEVAQYINEKYPSSRLWCTNIQLAKELDKDVWNEDEYRMYLLDTMYFSQVMKPGEIIVWDAHFSPNEGGTPLQKLRDYKGLKEIKRFTPQKPFKVLGDLDYEVVLFVVKE